MTIVIIERARLNALHVEQLANRTRQANRPNNDLGFGCRTVYRTSDGNPHGQFLYFIYLGARGWGIFGLRDFLRPCRSVWLVRHAPRATTNQQCDLGTSEIGARRNQCIARSRTLLRRTLLADERKLFQRV